MSQDPTTVHRSDSSSTGDRSFDLEAYFHRIGYSGPPAVNMKTLRAIQRLHPRAIAFENLSPLLGQPVRLDLSSLQQKMIYNRRGGYCFEHNLLLYHALKEIGFSVDRLAGRVLWNKPRTAITSRTHMLLLVKLEEKNYIADVGFGALTPTGPLLLEPETVQQTPHESCRLLEWKEGFLLQAEVQDEWKTLYRFNLHPQYFIDFKVANWYVATHPNSHFVNKLTAALAVPGRRYTLSNNKFSIHDQQEGTSKQKMTDVAQLHTLLEETFNVDLADLPEVDELLNRLIEEG